MPYRFCKTYNHTVCKHIINKFIIKMKIFKQIILLSILVLGFISSFAQQYTLQDTDVTVVDGVITNCTYDFSIKNIKIPDTLNNQRIIGIMDGGYHDGSFYEGVFNNKKIETLILPNTLEFIGDYAFQRNSFLDSIYLSSNLKRIGKEAFSYSGLKRIVFPNSIEKIDNSAFANSIKLSEISLPNNPLFKEISFRAFYNCDISDVTIPNTLRSIGGGVFAANDRLDSIQLPSLVVENSIGWIDYNSEIHALNSYVKDLNTFYFSVSSYTLTEEDVEIDENGYIRACYLENFFLNGKVLIIPEIIDGKTIKGIGDYSSLSFTATTGFNKKYLSGIVLPSTIEYIGNGAFSDNLLSSIIIPANVESIQGSAFSNNNLKELKFESNNTLLYIGRFAFCKNKLESVSLPSSLVKIDPGAFNRNDITKINNKETNGIFYYRYSSRDSIIIDSSKIVSFGGRYVRNLDFIPKNVKYLNAWSFSYIVIDTIRIPEGIEIIDMYTFDCLADTIILPQSVHTISNYAFAGISMDSILLPHTIKEGYSFEHWVKAADSSSVTHISDYSSTYYAKMTKISFEISGKFNEYISDVSFDVTGDIEDNWSLSNKDFSFTVNKGCSFKITPKAEGYEFNPQYYVIENITSDLVELNFSLTALNTYTKTTPDLLYYYPNPTKDYLTIKTSIDVIPENIVLTDLDGKTQTLEVENSASSELRLNMSHIPHGIYIVDFENVKGETFSIKVIKE
jgi:hypothetical protein